MVIETQNNDKLSLSHQEENIVALFITAYVIPQVTCFDLVFIKSYKIRTELASIWTNTEQSPIALGLFLTLVYYTFLFMPIVASLNKLTLKVLHKIYIDLYMNFMQDLRRYCLIHYVHEVTKYYNETLLSTSMSEQ